MNGKALFAGFTGTCGAGSCFRAVPARGGMPYGRSERGKRLVAHVPFGHWKTTTFLAASRHGGVTATCDFDGPPQPITTVAPPINGAKLLAYIEHVLVPTLSPGEIVMTDNSPPARGVWRAPLGSHKRAGVRKAIEAAGAAVCFLPAYAPEHNPDEYLNNDLKQTIKNKPRAKTRDDLSPPPRRSSDPSRSARIGSSHTSTQNTFAMLPDWS
jgi:transposase